MIKKLTVKGVSNIAKFIGDQGTDVGKAVKVSKTKAKKSPTTEEILEKVLAQLRGDAPVSREGAKRLNQYIDKISKD